jgi:Pentapeptide repeats (9 copies)
MRTDWHRANHLAYNWAVPDTYADDHVPAPDWPTCALSSEEAGRRCTGKQAAGFDRCLAHLEPDQLGQALQRLHPGAPLDASGTSIDSQLLAQILRAVQDKEQRPAFGAISFIRTHFTEDANFTGVAFHGNARFSLAQFTGNASFDSTTFTSGVRFDGAEFRETRFDSATFSLGALFHRAKFTEDVTFSDAEFSGNTRFDGAEFDGAAWFRGTKFIGDTSFSSVKFADAPMFDTTHFTGAAWFTGTQFTGTAAIFSRTQFSGDATFDGAKFTAQAWFDGAQFSKGASFGTQFAGASFTKARFAADAYFNGAEFTEDAWFDGAQFEAQAWFDGAQFSGNASFDDASFEKATSLGPLVADSLSLPGTTFGCPLVIEAAAATVSFRDATWSAGVTLRLRYAAIDLERATFSAPSYVTGADVPFDSCVGPLPEDQVVNHVVGERGKSLDLWAPHLTSLRGSDAANLSVTDVDLSECRFAGARLLDQLRLEGRCIFDQPPRGVRTGRAWPPVWWWSSRQSIAEERAWRATTHKHPGWRVSQDAQPADVRPERLAGLYRQLRKAQEDAKNEPGAADFYYGEMEMRRKATTTPAGERVILWLYWLISGYGLRALRSLAALGILAVIVTTALAGWGLAASPPPQHLTGTITSQADNRTRINATLSTAAPRLPAAGQRWTAQRARTAMEVTLDSVVFRTTDQPLTSAGTWISDAARILGPVLLGLALLALRGRVKR